MTVNRQTSQAFAYDVKLLFPVLFLVGIGIVMVYSASSALALKKYGTDSFFLKKQALFSLMGIVALVIGRHIPYTVYRTLAYPILFVSLALLVALHVPGLGYAAGGATRWLRFSGFTFQPSELARFALVVYLAYSLSSKSERLQELSVGFLPHVLVLGLFAILIVLQPDFGSVVILAAITWSMMFLAGVRILHLGASLLLLLPAAGYLMVYEPYRLRRVLSFLNPWKYPSGEGYQIIHSLMAFGTGGIWGTGIGNGYQKLFYLPEPHTDFIFSVLGEELGLLGVAGILALYVMILWRGVAIARGMESGFGFLLAAGITTAIAIQVGVNMGVTLGLLPPKGLTLPFLSYGGTSLVLNMASVGVLMNMGASR